MKSLLKEMKRYKKEVVLAPLFKMLEASFDLLVPLVMKEIIDTGIGGGDRGYVIRMCLVLILLALVGLGCSTVAQYFAARAAVGFSGKLRHMVFSHIQTLSFTELDTIGTSTLITRMTSDINQIQSGVNLTLRLFLRSPFVVFGAMIMAFTIDVPAALIFAVVIPLLSVVVFGIMLLTMPLYKKVQSALDQVTRKTRENLTGVRVLRAFRQEKAEETSFYEANDSLKALQQFAGRLSALMNPVTYVLINIATVVLIYVGAIRVDNGVLTQGAVIALVNYMSQILVELIKLADLIVTMTKAAACGNRVEAVLRGGNEKEAKTLTDPRDKTVGETLTDPAVPKVAFSHVSMHYGNIREASLTDVTFSVPAGSTVGIIGGTGAGKTTLVSLIPGFYPISEGSLKVDGKEVSDYALPELRKKVGIAQQESVLFNGTVRDNLSWGKENATDEEMLEALKMAQALDFVEEKGGLNSAVTEGGRNFSGGQRQRLSIARALLRKPEILILDDASSALDFATDAALRAALSELKDMTVFIVSQRAASLMAADQIIVLEDGRVDGIGTHAALLQSSPVYKEIYDSQFK